MFDEWYGKKPKGWFEAVRYNTAWRAWQASANRKGHKLVPVEPTKEMLEEVETEKEYLFTVSSDYCDIGIPSHTASEIYKAMIGVVE